jgi:hypothetical protein
MKASLGKKLLLVLCFLIMELTWASVARGEMEFGYSAYTGFLHYPEEIGGQTNYTYDRFTGGVSLLFNFNHIGLELDAMSGVTVDDDCRSLPFLLTANFLCYPLSQRLFSPYFKLGYGSFYTWLRLQDHHMTGEYAFSCRNLGGGITIQTEPGGSYLFAEYLLTNIYGDESIDDFNLDLFKIGYVIVF